MSKPTGKVVRSEATAEIEWVIAFDERNVRSGRPCA
jgi:hypothetical protein